MSATCPAGAEHIERLTDDGRSEHCDVTDVHAGCADTVGDNGAVHCDAASRADNAFYVADDTRAVVVDYVNGRDADSTDPGRVHAYVANSHAQHPSGLDTDSPCDYELDADSRSDYSAGTPAASINADDLDDAKGGDVDNTDYDGVDAYRRAGNDHIDHAERTCTSDIEHTNAESSCGHDVDHAEGADVERAECLPADAGSEPNRDAADVYIDRDADAPGTRRDHVDRAKDDGARADHDGCTGGRHGDVGDRACH